jgi:hypothetical protein
MTPFRLHASAASCGAAFTRSSSILPFRQGKLDGSMIVK